MNWFDLVLLMFAAFRLTHLIVSDSITEPLRRPLQPLPFVGELIGCYWCAGVWVSAALVAANWYWPAVSRPILLVLAVAGGQSFLESLIKKS